MEGVHRERTQPAFQGREGAPLFQKVEELDEDTAVFFALGGRRDTPRPSFTFESAKAEASDQLRSGVPPRRGPPSRDDSLTEGGVEPPGLFVPEKTTLGDSG
jgi:hypothetical protein